VCVCVCVRACVRAHRQDKKVAEKMMAVSAKKPANKGLTKAERTVRTRLPHPVSLDLDCSQLSAQLET
jgi:hypothetical protein